MRLVFGLVLILGLGLAGGAVYLAQGYLNQSTSEVEILRAQLAESVTTTEIYVAAVPLRFGHELTPDDVRLIKFPEESLPEGAFLEEAALFPDGNSSPRMVVRAMEANEPLLAVKVTEPGQQAGLTTMLSPGMRAATINVDAQSGGGGFIKPNDYADISWTGRHNGRERTYITYGSIRVLAIDQSFDQDDRSNRVPNTITIEGTPDQIQNIRALQSIGQLSFALLGPGEAAGRPTENSDIIEELLNGVEEEPDAPPPPEEECGVGVIRAGEDVGSQRINCN